MTRKAKVKVKVKNLDFFFLIYLSPGFVSSLLKERGEILGLVHDSLFLYASLSTLISYYFYVLVFFFFRKKKERNC